MDSQLSLALRRRILAQIALVTPALVVGCQTGGTSDTGEGGVTTNMGSGASTVGTASGDGDGDGGSGESGSEDSEGSTTAGTSMGSTSTTTTEGESETDPPPPPPPGETCEYAVAESVMKVDEFPECTIDISDYANPAAATVCTTPPDGVSCDELCNDGAGPCTDPYTCGGLNIDFNIQSCAPYFDDVLGMCCSLIVYEEDQNWGGLEGRPFAPDAGAWRRASVEFGAVRERCELPAKLAEQLAAYWLDAALAEHASVASFARFSTQLMRLGAPASLVRGAVAAARDEVAHARSCFALASRYAGRELRPGALLAHDGLAELSSSVDLRAAVRAAFIEGCLCETLAAHEAAQLAVRARDPQVVGHYEAIAADEARHAALAWGFVAWAVERQPELRAELAHSYRQFLAAQRPSPTAIQPDVLLDHGCPGETERARWQAGAVELVLAPCTASLLRGARV